MNSLPPELLTRVFEFVSCDRPHVDIAISRLVSKRFHALSSPFLIDTVVIADRPETLQKFHQVLDHPYFSKHVTRLVWDWSRYPDDPTSSLQAYRSYCEKYPWRSNTIAAYCTRHGKDAAELALLQDALSVSRPGRRQYQAATEALTEFIGDIEGGADSGQRLTMNELYDIAFHEYCRRFYAQFETGLMHFPKKALHAAFDKLPKLRHVFYSDFRALARSGESLRELCNRLFGQSLSPELMPDDEQGFHDYTEAGLTLESFLCFLSKANISRLESLSIGRSDKCAWDAPGLRYCVSPRVLIPDLPTDEVLLRQRRKLLRSLRHLYLPVEISYLPHALEVYWPVSNTQRLLSYTADSLTHLDLETGLYSGLHRDFFDLIAKAKAVFGDILGQIQFRALKTAVFRGWMIPLHDLEHFLLSHAGTLRNIHLINCCLAEASKGELINSIRSTLEPALALRGVEIYALMHEACCLQRYQYALRQQAEHIQELSFEDDEEEQEEPHTPLHDELDSLDHSDLEGLFLGGRPNAVTRVERKNGDLKARSRWWRGIHNSDDADDDVF